MFCSEEMAFMLWERIANPLINSCGGALIAHNIGKRLKGHHLNDEYANQYLEFAQFVDTFCDEILVYSDLEHLACDLIDNAHSIHPDKAVNLTKLPDEVFSKMTVFQMALRCKAKVS